MACRILVALVLAALLVPAASAGSFLDRQLKYPRVRKAYAARIKAVKADFIKAGAAWPARGVFLRAFKSDDVVELWAAPPRRAEQRGASWVLVRSFPVCARSGDLGPKAARGDGQVPEGFYTIDRFNPWSSYHLSLGLDYPNRVDRKRAEGLGSHPGSDIFVHGDCVTIGCLPLEDAPMEDLYLAAIVARDSGQRRIPVHVFPCRLDQPLCQRKLQRKAKGKPTYSAFWKALRPGYDAFEKAKVPPRMRPRRDGTYELIRP